MPTRPDVARRRPEKWGTESVSEEVAQLVALGLQVGAILVVWIGQQRDPLDDLQSVSFEADELSGIIRHHPDRGEFQVSQNLSANSVVSQVRSKAQPFVGLNRVG